MLQYHDIHVPLYSIQCTDPNKCSIQSSHLNIYATQRPFSSYWTNHKISHFPVGKGYKVGYFSSRNEQNFPPQIFPIGFHCWYSSGARVVWCSSGILNVPLSWARICSLFSRLFDGPPFNTSLWNPPAEDVITCAPATMIISASALRRESGRSENRRETLRFSEGSQRKATTMIVFISFSEPPISPVVTYGTARSPCRPNLLLSTVTDKKKTHRFLRGKMESVCFDRWGRHSESGKTLESSEILLGCLHNFSRSWKNKCMPYICSCAGYVCDPTKVRKI